MEELTIKEVKKFFKEAGDVMEGLEQLIAGGSGGRLVGTFKMLESSNYVRKNISAAFVAYEDYDDAQQKEVQEHFAEEFDLKNDGIENVVESLMFRAVEVADWVASGIKIIPQVIGILSLKDLLGKGK